jgi:hypothetical protein
LEVLNVLTAKWDINVARTVWEQEAREEVQEQTAIAMKNEGLTDEVIARVTKLPIDRIREIH